MPDRVGCPDLNVLRSAHGLREVFEYPLAVPWPTDDHQQAEQSGCRSPPADRTARQNTAHSEAQEAEQQGQILYIGKDADFRADPADQGQLGEECEKAG